MFLIRTLLSQGTILCIVLLAVTLDVGFSAGKPTAKPYVIPLVLAACLLLSGASVDLDAAEQRVAHRFRRV